MSALFGAPLVNNAFRGTLVEAMLAQELEPEWQWCSADWASHDFENQTGTRIEVKQSAALQSWHTDGFALNRGRFDIAARKHRWEGTKRLDLDGRFASIYLFAWHGETDPDVADHRASAQWEFYVVRETELPQQKTIAKSRIAKLASPLPIEGVSGRLAKLLEE